MRLPAEVWIVVMAADYAGSDRISITSEVIGTASTSGIGESGDDSQSPPLWGRCLARQKGRCPADLSTVGSYFAGQK
jgi:hypothetical protein